VSLKQRVRNKLPRSLQPIAKAIYYAVFRQTLRPRCAFMELRETLDPFLKKRIRQVASQNLPPPLMRYRVGGDTDPLLFVAIGERIVEDLERALKLHKARLADFSNVLDFGCGCGRTLARLTHRLPNQNFFGTDIDAEAIAWCSRNLRPARFQTNAPDPPLQFADDTFDLVYAISIFTHLDRRRQEQWTREFHRILRPGGSLVVTVNGETAAKQAGLDFAGLSDLVENGVSFLKCSKLSGIHPDWYQTSFNDPSYTQLAFGRYFDDLFYLSGVFGFQDAIVCRKAALSESGSYT
jgi:SAM-dependent methyltransferase